MIKLKFYNSEKVIFPTLSSSCTVFFDKLTRFFTWFNCYCLIFIQIP